MNELDSFNQTKLFGVNRFLSELIGLYHKKKFPNKILLSGQKGLGKSTLAYHFINYVLSQDEEFKYDLDNFCIDNRNRSYKTVINKSNPNLIILDIDLEKKFIDINQIRVLISNLNKSSFNSKPRFVLIDNIEHLNINSINALLKVLEEPNHNVHFILVNNNRKILPTLFSRCLNFKIYLNNKESIEAANLLLDKKLYDSVNKDIINYYTTPGNIYNLVKFSQINEINLKNLKLKEFLKIFIKESYYKKDNMIRDIIFDLIEYYFRKVDLSITSNINNKYNYFLKRISDTKKFNLDEDSLFIEFEEEILNE